MTRVFAASAAAVVGIVGILGVATTAYAGVSGTENYHMSCPYTAGAGETLVKFSSNEVIISNSSQGDATVTTSASVPAGTYDVYLAASDGYANRVNVSQAHEQYKVILKKGGTTIATTNATPDLADKQAKVEWSGKVNSSMAVGSAADTVVAYHAYYGDTSSPNSLAPICMLLKPIAACGNGKVEAGEQCDDGNKNNNDGCSASCQKETAAISIDKNDNDNKDDTQKVKAGGVATYTITVVNTGKVSLKDVVVTDSVSANCSRSAAQTKGMYAGDTFDPGESFSYVCTDTNVTKSHESTASVVGKPINGGSDVKDSDPTRVTIEGGASIAIDKNDTDNGDDNQTIDEGGASTFKVTVKNDGDFPVSNVVITDELAPDCNRSADQTKALYGADVFEPGKSFSYTCKRDGVKESYKNIVSVTAKSMVADQGPATVSASDKSYVTVKGKTPVEPEPKPIPKEDKDCSGSIGNLVWNDKNNNGKQDPGEPGIPGVRVWLYQGNSVDKDTTDKNGEYKFKDLCKGEYRVVVKKEDLGLGMYQTYDPDGKLDHGTKVRLESNNDDHTKADFGYRGAVAPATGPGTVISVILAVLAAGGIVYFYRRRRMQRAL